VAIDQLMIYRMAYTKQKRHVSGVVA
jgi:hypothetical protein